MDKKLDKYAELIIKQGINLAKGEELGLNTPTHCADLAHAIVEQAYKAGAKKVTVFYNNSRISKLHYLYCDDDTITEVPEWLVKSREYILEKKASWISIISDEPDLMDDVNPEKIIKASRASRKAMEKFSESTSTNKTRWCLVGAPNPTWAKKMFPGLSEDAALEKQWEYMHKTLRLDTPDALAAWKDHQDALGRRSKTLNDAKIKTFHYKNKYGTDFTVGMPKGYKFTGAVEESQDGVEFTANLPTEEVFSSPDKSTANGKLVSSMPLLHNGQLIEDFWFRFENGRVVDYGAKKGLDNLKGIIETDEGSAYLGEIALVGYNSPIQNLKTLFYCTLFDENASCHFALGKGFAACMENGLKMSREELIKKGVNYSLEHVDFMVGTEDLEITATTEDGKEMPIFKNGDWVF